MLTMPDKARQHVLDFYSRHPISAAQILAKLRAERGHLDGLRPEELFAHDQDHYGGLAANDALAARAGITTGARIADFCAGLAGPARYFAHRYGAVVIGIELNVGRAQGARALTHHVGLHQQVHVVCGDVMRAPLADRSMDVVVSQEAFLHVPDKRRALAEAYRVLKPGGRLAFTDWIVHRPLSPDEAETLWQGIAAQTVGSSAGYRRALSDAGFAVLAADDLTAEWGTILAERLAMYRKLREETRCAGLPAGDDAFYRAYERLVALVQAKALGGARFLGQR